MKVKVLSLLVPALLVAGAANAAEVYNKDGNKLDLYGKVDGLHYFSDNKDVDGDQTYMRLGFKGETQVTDQLTGYGQWEYQIQGNSAENENNSWTRVAFAGLKFQDVGSFDYGRNYGVVYDVTSWTDVLPEFGGDTYGSDNFMQQRGNGDRAETYTGGLKYDANNIYLAAQYTQTYNATRVGSLGWANKAQNFEAVAQYQFDFGLRPSVAYLQSKGKNLGTIGTRNYDDEDILKYVDVGATYYFNKNMSTYVDYKINLLDDNQFTRDAGINTDNIVALGLVYQF
ncbi:TPA: porin [Escherichia coli]|nr:porin [Escherichia coli]